MRQFEFRTDEVAENLTFLTVSYDEHLPQSFIVTGQRVVAAT